MLPFGVLPLEPAAVLWMGLSFIAVAVGSAASWRAAGGARDGLLFFLALVLTAQPFWLLVVYGQITGIMLGLAGLAALFIARREDARAGIVFALLVLKPQIAGAFGPLVFLRSARDRPRFAVAAAGTLAALAVATILLRPGWPGEWLAELVGRRVRVSGLLSTAWGLSADLFGSWAVALVLIAVLVLGIALIVGHVPGHLAFAAIALPVSLFVSPYAWSYDQLVLVLPWALVIAIAVRARGVARSALLVATAVVAGLLPWSLYAIAFTRGLETLNAIVPALTALLVAVAVRLEEPRGAPVRSAAR
jgi:hypothetical protein